MQALGLNQVVETHGGKKKHAEAENRKRRQNVNKRSHNGAPNAGARRKLLGTEKRRERVSPLCLATYYNQQREKTVGGFWGA